MKLIIRSVRESLIVLVLITAITGIAYPVMMFGIGTLLFPDRIHGSLIIDQTGYRGSTLIGQEFTSPEHFHGRPSASGYSALPAAATHRAQTSVALRDSVLARTLRLKAESGDQGPVPMELVFASGSGLDPHISPEAAKYQIPRVAASLNRDHRDLERLIDSLTEKQDWLLGGKPRVSVLDLNRHLATWSTP